MDFKAGAFELHALLSVPLCRQTPLEPTPLETLSGVVRRWNLKHDVGVLSESNLSAHREKWRVVPSCSGVVWQPFCVDDCCAEGAWDTTLQKLSDGEWSMRDRMVHDQARLRGSAGHPDSRLGL